MTFSDFLTKLSYGELSNLSMANDASGEISTSQHRRILGLVNDGLEELYSRFLIQKNEVILEIQEDVTQYFLRTMYASTDDTPDYTKYLKDTEESPFLGLVVKILDVYDEMGRVLVKDKVSCDPLIKIPYYDSLKIEGAETGALLSIIYQSKHTPLVVRDDNTVDLTQTILIPSRMRVALQSYVAWKIYAPMNGENHLINAQKYQATFENECAQIEGKDIVASSESVETSKFEERGWV